MFFNCVLDVTDDFPLKISLFISSVLRNTGLFLYTHKLDIELEQNVSSNLLILILFDLVAFCPLPLGQFVYGLFFPFHKQSFLISKHYIFIYKKT